MAFATLLGHAEPAPESVAAFFAELEEEPFSELQLPKDASQRPSATMAFATVLGHAEPDLESEEGLFAELLGEDPFSAELQGLSSLPTSKALLAELSRGYRERVGRCCAPLERVVSPQLTFEVALHETMLSDSSLNEDCLLLAMCPDEVLTRFLSFSAGVAHIGTLAAVCPRVSTVLRLPEVWEGHSVKLPSTLVALAPQLHQWLPAWRGCERLLVPRSAQLLRELELHAPQIPIHVLWRFSNAMKGAGVEVLNHGRSVRRCAEDDLVVLADAPLVKEPHKPLYLEVSLDDRSEDAGDGVNDFGLGVTFSPPEELKDLGCVADEVPDSLVVNFTTASVVVVADNQEVFRGSEMCSQDLSEGDVVGVMLLKGTIRVYLNGQQRLKLELPKSAQIPVDKQLFPVFDLCGRAVQLSRT